MRRPDGVIEIDAEEFDAECEMIETHTRNMQEMVAERDALIAVQDQQCEQANGQVTTLTRQLEIMTIRAMPLWVDCPVELRQPRLRQWDSKVPGMHHRNRRE